MGQAARDESFRNMAMIMDRWDTWSKAKEKRGRMPDNKVSHIPHRHSNAGRDISNTPLFSGGGIKIAGGGRGCSQ